MEAVYSAPVQTGPGAHPASCTMGIGSFPGVKSGQGVTLTPHPLQCRGHERVELYLYCPYGPYGLYRASVPVQGCTLHLHEDQHVFLYTTSTVTRQILTTKPRMHKNCYYLPAGSLRYMHRTKNSFAEVEHVRSTPN